MKSPSKLIHEFRGRIALNQDHRDRPLQILGELRIRRTQVFQERMSPMEITTSVTRNLDE